MSDGSKNGFEIWYENPVTQDYTHKYTYKVAP